MSRHLGPAPSPSPEPGGPGVRGLELAFAGWLTTRGTSRHAEDVALRLQVLRTSRRDLLRRRGERRPDRVLLALTPGDVDLLAAQSRRAAQWWGRETGAELRGTCASWLEHLQFLGETGRWEGDVRTAVAVRAELMRHLRTRRAEPLAGGGHCAQTSAPVELAHLRRTRLVQEAEDALRGRTSGTPRLQARLEDLGFVRTDGRRGPRWSSWDSLDELHAACARRRLVVAEVVRVLATRDEDCAPALALATSDQPAEVAEGGRRLEVAVSRGVLAELVEAGIVPARAPWRIARGLQHSVHVALSRLVDDGVLDEGLRRPVLAAAG